MKKTIKFLILFLALFIVFSSVSFATSVNNNVLEDISDIDYIADDIELTGTTIENADNDVFAANNEVLIKGSTNGNAFVLGQYVDITGRIDGDLFVLANSLTISTGAEITGNVFALAQEITIDGKANTVYALSNTFNLKENSVITRNLNLSCTTASFEGRIGKDVYLSANEFTFADNARNIVGQNFYYSAEQEMVIPEGAVNGTVNFTLTETTDTTPTVSDYLLAFFMVFLYAACVILLTTRLAPNFAKKSTASMTKKPFKVALVGILAFILIPIAVLLLMLSVSIFTYISLAVLAVYILMLSVSISILGMAIANYVTAKLKKESNTMFIILSLAAVAILWLLQHIPAIGGYVSIFTVVYGFGLFVYSLFSKKILEQTN